MKKIISISFLCISTFFAIAENSNNIEEIAKIYLPAPKILAQKYFNLLQKIGYTKQEQMQQLIIATLLGYPNFDGVSSSETLNIAIYNKNNKYLTFAEVSADEKSIFVRNLRNFIKLEPRDNRMVAQLTGDKDTTLAKEISFETTSTTALIQAYISKPEILTNFIPLPDFFTKYLKNSKNAKVEIDDENNTLVINIILESKSNTQEFETGIELATLLPKNDTEISANIIDKNGIEIPVKTQYGNVSIQTRGNCSISINSLKQQIHIVMLGKIIDSTNATIDGKIYQLLSNSISKANLWSIPLTNVLFTSFENFVVLSTDETKLNEITAKLKSLKITKPKTPNITFRQQSNKQTLNAKISFSKEVINLQVAIPYEWGKSLLDNINTYLSTNQTQQ
ncbi:MAG: hypothetical protein J6B07_01210 [Opitutales bacterium]|nr:hypothetical protein [Opitutales bacterium]